MKRQVALVLILAVVLLFIGCDTPVDSSGSDSGTSNPDTPPPSIVKILASDAAAGDRFGYSVAIDGDYTIVGAPYDDDNGTVSGSAYIFHRTGPNSWGTGTKITASDAAADDRFGASVAISGDYAIIGAYQDDVDVDGDTTDEADAGSAYVFRRTGTNSWDTGTKITASSGDGAAGDFFGYSVSISGDYAIVSAFYDDTRTGSAYVFNRTGTNSWDGGTKIVASDPNTNDDFGHSVSIDADYAIVGAPGDDDGASSAGSAYIFNRTGTNSWDAGTKILASDRDAFDQFGTSVSISGDYAIVGSGNNDDNGSNSGSAYIFRRTGSNSWDTGTKILASDGAADDSFGQAVSISGDYAIVGADGVSSSVGGAYLFRRTGTNSWEEKTKISASDGAADDEFGAAVSIDGDYAMIGAPSNDDNGTDSGSGYMKLIAP